MQFGEPETVRLPAKNLGKTETPSIVKAVALYPVAPFVFKKVTVTDSPVFKIEFKDSVSEDCKLSVQLLVAASV
jgi:hypothetical protein